MFKLLSNSMLEIIYHVNNSLSISLSWINIVVMLLYLIELNTRYFLKPTNKNNVYVEH